MGRPPLSNITIRIRQGKKHKVTHKLAIESERPNLKPNALIAEPLNPSNI